MDALSGQAEMLGGPHYNIRPGFVNAPGQEGSYLIFALLSHRRTS